MKRLLYIIVLMLIPFTVLAQQLGDDKATAEAQSKDSVVVSLLTCTPGQLVYELYGHTAIRVKEVGARQSDWVFNYGTFSFNQPHFVWRFMLGETDYELGVVPYSIFYEFYVKEGRGIDEQVLNLSSTETKRLVDALSKNLEPENATYRYNFFYDNCVTRALRQIENAVEGTVVWPKADENKTLRDIVHEFSTPSPWNEFGQDLLLGAEADEKADLAKQQFAPIYAERFVTDAMIKDKDGKVRHLAAPVRTLLPAQPGVQTEESGFPLSPTVVFGIILVLTIAISTAELLRKKRYWQYDVLLMVAQGLTGCIITFLFFFSSHPAVGSNWLITLFNPLPLVLFPWFMKAAAVGKRSWVMYVQGVLVVLFIISAVLGVQQYPTEVHLIAVTLLVRVIEHFRPEIRKD